MSSFRLALQRYRLNQWKACRRGPISECVVAEATRRRREIESSIRRRDRRRIIREWALHRQDEIFGMDTGAFAHYRYQSCLFPRMIFRLAYDELQSSAPERADRDYLRLLKLAADESEDRVAEALRVMIERGEAISLELTREMLSADDGRSDGLPQVIISATPLASYDELLSSEEVAA